MKPIRSSRRGGCWVIHDVWSPGLCYQPLMMKAETDRMLLIIPSICLTSLQSRISPISLPTSLSIISMTKGRKHFIKADDHSVQCPSADPSLESGNQNKYQTVMWHHRAIWTWHHPRGFRSYFRKTVMLQLGFINQLSICLQCFLWEITAGKIIDSLEEFVLNWVHIEISDFITWFRSGSVDSHRLLNILRVWSRVYD